MTTSNIIQKEAHSLNPDSIITMFEVDLHGTIIRICSEGTVSFGNETYIAFPIKAEGFKFDGKGAMPRPTLVIASDPSLIELIDNPSGFVGSTVTRIRTYRKFLDDGETPDSEAHFPKDKYIIDRKTSHTSEGISFELCAYIDQEGKRIPARQIIRDTCPFVYRRYSQNTQSFTYHDVMGCPYAGEDCYTEAGLPTTVKSLDKCGKRLSDCQLRFNTSEVGVPFGGFPGVGRIGK